MMASQAVLPAHAGAGTPGDQAVTVAGGHGYGSATKQLHREPPGIRLASSAEGYPIAVDGDGDVFTFNSYFTYDQIDMWPPGATNPS